MTAGRPIRPVGLGIVGAGSAARQHLAALAECPDVVPLAVADPDPQALARLTGDGAPAVRTVAGLDDLLADEAIELVAIATPPGSHEPLAKQVLASGRAVLLEKPPTLSTAQLASVVADADARGLVAGVMLQHRFRIPPPARTRSWGPATVANLEVVRHRPVQHYQRAGWRTDPAASGGGLVAHLGVHYLDLACQVLGRPTEVLGVVDTLPDTAIDQRVGLLARFDSGALLSFVGTTGIDGRSERLAVYDDGRSLIVSGGATDYVVDTRTSRAAPSTPSLRAAVYADVARAVREGRPPATADLRGAAGVITLLEHVRRPRRTGRAA
jgi:predicted dehydrogenase